MGGWVGGIGGGGGLTYFWRSPVVALCAINMSVIVALTSNIPLADIPRDLSPDSQDESSDTEEVREFHFAVVQLQVCRYWICYLSS